MKHCIECWIHNNCKWYNKLSDEMSKKYNDPNVMNIVNVINEGNAKMKELATNCEFYMHFDAN